ncbi:hypothetical protein C8J56DRAFT_910265 [Mycena floridula]|nr:hypothetical protein C8J56DRAFT_910265 [Mycena floridula]
MPSKARTKPKKPIETTLAAKPAATFSLRTLTVYFSSLIAVAASLWIYLDQKEPDVKPFDLGQPPPAFEVVEIPGKGKGVLAIRDIHQGKLIIRERPLFIVPHKVTTSPTELLMDRLRELSSFEYQSFFNLSYVNFPSGLDPQVHLDQLALAIFQTNAVAAGDGVGIFPGMARLNHGCSSAFNVVYSWREYEGALVVHAIKDVKAGEELLTTYSDMKRPRNQRREYLSSIYGFTCTCAVCSLPEIESQASDQRLSTISELYEHFALWGSKAITGKEAIATVHQIWDLGSVEGYWSERGSLAADAVWVASAHSDEKAARSWANVAIRWYGYELGKDSVQVKEMLQIMANPTRHQAWGSREALDVGLPNLNG